MPYNALLFILGCIALPIFFAAMMHSGELKPGEDPVEPLALLAAPVLANVAYTLGWFTEIVVNLVCLPARRIGPHLLRTGLIFSALMVFLPAVASSVVWASHLVVR